MRIRTGSTVKHDFSLTKGTVLKIRNHKHRYNYFVQWESGESDWYLRKVLIVVK